MKEILVRADDLGYSEAVNYGLAKTLREGIIRSVGIMVNMPYTKHGYELIKDLDFCKGLHTNICVGRPLCNPSDVKSICDENGNLRASRDYRESYKKGIDFVDLDEVIMEIEAQYEAFVKLTGEKPHYFEGHAVMSDNFNKGLEIVAKRHDCEYLAASFNGPVKFRNTYLVASMDSVRPDYDPFESLKREVLRTDLKDNERVMFVCHPGYLDDFILRTSSLTVARTKEVEMAVSEETKKWLKDNDVRIITYDDLR